MKKILFTGMCFFISTFTMNVMAQETAIKVQKEVIVEEENDEMKLTIKTTSGSVVREEVYTGDEAKAKLAEMEKDALAEEGTKSETSEEISIHEVDGQRELRIKRTVDGVVNEEVFTGAEAEARIKELEETKVLKTTEKRVEKRKVVNAVE